MLLRIRLKSSKESRNYCRGTIVEVFGNNSVTCPVAAFTDYLKIAGNIHTDCAAFRTGDGWALRHGRVNAELKRILSPYVTYGSISGHSFRAGLASLMAEKGMSDDDIRTQGRWSSEAFKRYIKMTRVTRIRVALRLSNPNI